MVVGPSDGYSLGDLRTTGGKNVPKETLDGPTQSTDTPASASRFTTSVPRRNSGSIGRTLQSHAGPTALTRAP
jgi:hypothetical protein